MTKLKYEFINKDHEKMHQILMENGWGCANDALSPSMEKYNWVYHKDGEHIYFDNFDKKIFYRDADGILLSFYYYSFERAVNFIESKLKAKQPTLKVEDNHYYKSHYLADATCNITKFVRCINNDGCDDILDIGKIYEVLRTFENHHGEIFLDIGNPQSWIFSVNKFTSVEECDETTLNSINKDNIKEVLEYNNISNVDVMTNHISVAKTCSISMRSENWFQILEAAIGKKLEPLPKFDFVQYLLDNGFEICSEVMFQVYIKNGVSIHSNINKSEFFLGRRIFENKIKPTLANAKILIKMAKLGEELE